MSEEDILAIFAGVLYLACVDIFSTYTTIKKQVNKIPHFTLNVSVNTMEPSLDYLCLNANLKLYYKLAVAKVVII